MYEALGSNPSTSSTRCGFAHTSNSRTQEVEEGEFGVHSYPWLCREFEASLSYRISCLKNQTRVAVPGCYPHSNGWHGAWCQLLPGTRSHTETAVTYFLLSYIALGTCSLGLDSDWWPYLTSPLSISEKPAVEVGHSDGEGRRSVSCDQKTEVPDLQKLVPSHHLLLSPTIRSHKTARGIL